MDMIGFSFDLVSWLVVVFLGIPVLSLVIGFIKLFCGGGKNKF